MQDDVQSLSHSKWRCKYHIVFTPKYRGQIIYGKLKSDVGKTLRELSARKGVTVLEGECCPDHIHMLVEIPPHLSVSQYMGYLKSKSSLMIFDRHANLKYKYGNRHFWCRGYNAVQEEKARRAARFNKHPQSTKSYPFSSLLVCANCGKNYHRKTTKTGPVWVCGTFNTQGKAHCASKQIPEDALSSVTTEVISMSLNDESVLKNCLYQITVHNGNRLLFTFANGTTVECIWQDRSRSQSWTPETKEAARQKALERRKSNA